MVVRTRTNSESGSEEEQVRSPKQLQRLEEQKARAERKAAKRAEKALQKERVAAEKERRAEEREKRLEEERLEKQILTPLQEEQAQRLKEEKELLEKEFMSTPKVVHHSHVKKSALESNRMGGHHMS
mmetsp:Transcript_21875/g.32325  ORF Transcript_21875/g.32325 Transcript_21875/m.32325 type:complete len:127 (+) Transcript_21875:83-463(+)|eukprot:CAMPEP_0194207654 /NCGR_PEP_ID=MMETSP0156-20130528/6326_1 /TAXON_ID=33649 /ORGANISM="Thalassionema nitzschioides, Strain L26-B" /LENGTH=126 /DNA_ID=CAMNT_0038934459 /DNA_START=120 /DNA_END=500 /DNA_ORIENTATION=+